MTTHDLPPSAGYLSGAHIELRDKLGMLKHSAEEENANDLAWQSEVLDRAREEGAFAGTELATTQFRGLARDERGSVEALVVGLNRFIAGTPSALTCVSLVDMVGEIRPQNQPGTMQHQYPNWCVPLGDSQGSPVLIEDLTGIELFHQVAQASQR